MLTTGPRRFAIDAVQFARAVLGREVFFRRDVRLPVECFGSSKADWPISLAMLPEPARVYSFGVGDDISFELELARRAQVKVSLFDPTPRSLAWIEQQELPEGFDFHAMGIADVDGEIAFVEPPDPTHVSYSMLRDSDGDKQHTFPVKRLSTSMAELGDEQIDVLKMDVEGAEYGVIDDLAEGETRPAHLLVEFHQRFSDDGIARTRQAVRTLRDIGYRIYAISDLYWEYALIHESAVR